MPPPASFCADARGAGTPITRPECRAARDALHPLPGVKSCGPQLVKRYGGRTRTADVAEMFRDGAAKLWLSNDEDVEAIAEEMITSGAPCRKRWMPSRPTT